MLSAVFNMLGALVVGTAVATTVAGIVTVAPASGVAVIGAGALAATIWNGLTWWRGLPSSSGHALVGGWSGRRSPRVAQAPCEWGGLEGWRPVGVFGVLIALAVSPPLGLAFGFAAIRVSRRLSRRASRLVEGPVRAAEWTMSAALSFSHGANDGQKSMGVVAGLLVASGHLQTFSVPLWTKLACGAALTSARRLGAGGSYARSAGASSA